MVVNNGLERTHKQRSARGKMMWMDTTIVQSESVFGSSSSLERYIYFNVGFTQGND